MVELGTLGGALSEAHAINQRGDAVGCAETPGGAQHAVLWRNGALLDLGTLGGTFTHA